MDFTGLKNSALTHCNEASTVVLLYAVLKLGYPDVPLTWIIIWVRQRLYIKTKVFVCFRGIAMCMHKGWLMWLTISLWQQNVLRVVGVAMCRLKLLMWVLPVSLQQYIHMKLAKCTTTVILFKQQSISTCNSMRVCRQFLHTHTK